MSDELLSAQTRCPKCGVWLDDVDGFGVLAHDACGYCSHPSSTGGKCDICGLYEKLIWVDQHGKEIVD